MRKILIILTIFMAFLTPATADEWNLKRITNDPLKMDWTMGITADGSNVLFISETDDNRNSIWDLEVFLADLNVGEVTRITTNIYAELSASISADGNAIAYLTRKPSSWGYGWIIEVNLAEFSGNWQSHAIASFDASNCKKPAVRISNEGILAVGCDEEWYIIDSSGNRLRELPRTYSYGHISENRFAYAPETKFYNSAVYPSRLSVISLPNTAGLSYYAGEGKYLGWSFDVSSNGDLAFLLVSLERGEDTGIYQFTKNLLVHRYTGYVSPHYDRVRLSDDGSKLFYQGWNYTVTASYSVIYEVSNGRLELIKDRLLLEDVNADGSRIVAKWLQNGYSDLFVISRATFQPLNFNLNFSGAMPFLPETLVFQSASSKNDVQIPLLIKNAENIGSLDLRLEYPSDVLEATDIIPGSLTQNSLMEYNIKNGRISVGIVDTEGISGDGSLLYVKFRVKEYSDGGKKNHG